MASSTLNFDMSIVTNMGASQIPKKKKKKKKKKRTANIIDPDETARYDIVSVLVCRAERVNHALRFVFIYAPHRHLFF